MRDKNLTEKEKKLFQTLLKEEQPPQQLEKNIVNQLKDEGLISKSRMIPVYFRRAASFAAMLLMAILFFIAGMYYEKNNETAIDNIETKQGYMLLLHEDEHFQVGDPQAMFEEYSQWMENTLNKGVKISGQELKIEAVMVSDSGTKVSKHAEERITGYFLLEADTLEDAVQVAKENPHIKYGGTIEVKPYMVH